MRSFQRFAFTNTSQIGLLIVEIDLRTMAIELLWCFCGCTWKLLDHGSGRRNEHVMGYLKHR